MDKSGIDAVCSACEGSCAEDTLRKEGKAGLRALLRRKRRELSEEARMEAASAVANRVLSLDEYKSAGTILAYMPVKGELDVMPIVHDAWRCGKRVAFPLCVENGGLMLLVPDSPEAFSVGLYGIPEPDRERSKELHADELDIIIVPAVAFNADCARLGQGGGYYDRLLVKTDAFTVGVGYDFQLVENLPIEAHDMGLDCVALPHELIRRSGL